MTKISSPPAKGNRRAIGPHCCSCGKSVPQLGCCPPCWTGLKTFRRYLRETLGLEPIHGDVPANEQGSKFRVWEKPSLWTATHGQGRR